MGSYMCVEQNEKIDKLAKQVEICRFKMMILQRKMEMSIDRLETEVYRVESMVDRDNSSLGGLVEIHDEGYENSDHC